MILERLKINFTERYLVPNWVCTLFLTIGLLNEKYGHNKLDIVYAVILMSFMTSSKDSAIENKYRWLTKVYLSVLWFFTGSIIFMSFFGEAIDKWLVTKGF